MAADLDRQRPGLSDRTRRQLNEDLAALADGTAIADDSIDSRHYVALSIDNEHLAADSVSATKIAADQVTTAKIAEKAVSNARFRDSGALAVVGRAANSTGSVADIQATATSDAVLRESGSTIGFGTVAAAGIASGAVVQAKLNTSTASASGTLADTSGVTITIGGYAFWPMISGAGLVMQAAASDAEPDDGKFRLRNDTGGNVDYSVEWRQVDAS